jgi:hypothetical protein
MIEQIRAHLATQLPDARIYAGHLYRWIEALLLRLDQREQEKADLQTYIGHCESALTMSVRLETFNAEQQERIALQDRCLALEARLAESERQGEQWMLGEELTNARCEKAEAAVSALQARLMWQPIDTAPDNTEVLIWWPYWCSRPTIGRKRFGGWNCDSSLTTIDAPTPTHWMPLPPPATEPQT